MADRVRYVLSVDDQGTPTLTRFGNAAQRSGQQSSSAFQRTSSSANTMFRSLSQLTIAGYGVSQALSAASRAGIAIVQAASQYDSLKMRLQGIEGSAQGANLALSNMQELSKMQGLGFEQAASAYAGLRSLKRDGPEAIEIIKGIARANANMGGGAEEFGRVMRQMQQIIGKGKLMAEDVSTISESLPNFRALMLEAFGTTSAEAINAKYSMDEFLAGIVNAAKALPEPADTIKNNMDNLADSWTRLKASIGDTDAIKSATKSLGDFLETLAKAQEGRNRTAELLKAQGHQGTGAEVSRIGGQTKLGRVAQLTALSMYISPLLAAKALYTGNSVFDYLYTPETAPLETSQSGATKYAKQMPFATQSAAKKKSQTMAQATANGLRKGPKAQDVNVDFWQVGGNDLAATQWNWNQARGVDRDLTASRKKEADKAAEEARKKAEKDAQEAEELAKRNSDRIHSYYVTMSTDASSVLSSSFAEIGNGFQAMTDAMVEGFKTMLIRMAAELAANAAIFGILNLFSGGIAGSFASSLGGLSGLILGRATGGSLDAGEAAVVGERRAEIFIPRGPGRVEPVASSGPGITIVVQNPAEARSLVRDLDRDQRNRRTGLR